MGRQLILLLLGVVYLVQALGCGAKTSVGPPRTTPVEVFKDKGVQTQGTSLSIKPPK